MAEIDCRKLGLVEEGGYELARAGHVIAVGCKRVRKEEKKMPKMLTDTQQNTQIQITAHDILPGAAVAAPIKQEIENQNQNQTKAREPCPTQCNKRKLSSRKQHNDNNTLYQKTLTAEIQHFQMRKMNQR